MGSKRTNVYPHDNAHGNTHENADYHSHSNAHAYADSNSGTVLRAAREYIFALAGHADPGCPVPDAD